MTDFGQLLANLRILFLGAAAQFGIFATMLGAVCLSATGLMDFSLNRSAAIGNIVAIFLGLPVGSKLVADQFLAVEALGIMGLGVVAISIGTAVAAGVMSKDPG